MENKEVTSKQFQVNIKDILRSLVLAVGTPLLVQIQRVLDSGTWDFNWKQLGMIAVGAAVAYLLKNFFTSPSIKIPIENKEVEASKELPQAAK